MNKLQRYKELKRSLLKSFKLKEMDKKEYSLAVLFALELLDRLMRKAILEELEK